MNEHSRSELPATVAFSRNDENGVNKTVCVTKGVCGWAREQWRVAVDASGAEDKQRSWQFSSRRWLHRLYASRSKTKLTASWQAEAQASPSAGLSEMHQISSHCCDQYNFIMAAQRTSTSAVSAAAHIGLVSYWHGCYLSQLMRWFSLPSLQNCHLDLLPAYNGLNQLISLPDTLSDLKCCLLDYL